MLAIGTAAYQNASSLLTADNRLIRQAASTTSATSQASALASTASTSADRVSLSPEVDAARLRESLGLNPTGKLRRQDFEAMIQSDQEGVRQTMRTALDTLAPGAAGDTVGTLTLSQDAKGRIQVAGDWPGKDELAKKLNADPEFSKMFARLEVNSGLVNYADQMVGGEQGATLADYLDSDSADSNLSTLLQQYDSLKSSKNSLASLIDLSSSAGKPFSLAFDNSAAPSK